MFLMDQLSSALFQEQFLDCILFVVTSVSCQLVQKLYFSFKGMGKS